MSGTRPIRRLAVVNRGDDNVGVLSRRVSWTGARETHRLERGLTFLATTGSAAPFIGLFGTVTGLMASWILAGRDEADDEELG